MAEQLTIILSVVGSFLIGVNFIWSLNLLFLFRVLVLAEVSSLLPSDLFAFNLLMIWCLWENVHSGFNDVLGNGSKFSKGTVLLWKKFELKSSLLKVIFFKYLHLLFSQLLDKNQNWPTIRIHFLNMCIITLIIQF